MIRCNDCKATLDDGATTCPICGSANLWRPQRAGATGYYAAPPPKGPTIKLVPILGVLVLIGGVVIAYRELAGGPSPKPGPAMTRTAAPEVMTQRVQREPPTGLRPAVDASGADSEPLSAEAEYALLIQQLDDERSENAALRMQLEEANGEIERYQTGLDRCVEQLNADQKTAQAREILAAADARRQAQRPRGSASSMVVHEPTFYFLSNSWNVSGTVFNASSQPITGNVVLSVIDSQSGGVVTSRVIRMQVPPGQRASYDEMIDENQTGGNGYVQAEWQ